MIKRETRSGTILDKMAHKARHSQNIHHHRKLAKQRSLHWIGITRLPINESPAVTSVRKDIATTNSTIIIRVCWLSTSCFHVPVLPADPAHHHSSRHIITAQPNPGDQHPKRSPTLGQIHYRQQQQRPPRPKPMPMPKTTLPSWRCQCPSCSQRTRRQWTRSSSSPRRSP